jgi:hypothetical protein
VDEILPRLSLNIHNPEFSSSREDTPGPVIVVAAAQLSGGGGSSQLAGTGGLTRNTGKRVGANVRITDILQHFATCSDVLLMKALVGEALVHRTL